MLLVQLLSACQAPEEPEPIGPVDTDGDGLSDAREARLGTDAHAVDTDGDSYTDRDEVTEGSDPVDPKDRIYQGRWPYWADKDAIAATDLPRLVLTDQFGDDVDLWDWYGAGSLLILELDPLWVPKTYTLAEWRSGDGEGHEDLVESLELGTLKWITILTEGDSGDDPTADEQQAFATHGSPPVLADQGHVARDTFSPAAYPTLIVYGETLMELGRADGRNSGDALDAASALLAER